MFHWTFLISSLSTHLYHYSSLAICPLQSQLNQKKVVPHNAIKSLNYWQVNAANGNSMVLRSITHVTRATKGVSGAHLHQACKHCVIRAILSHCAITLLEGTDVAHLSPSGNIKGLLLHIPVILWWYCSNDKRFINLVKVSSSQPCSGLEIKNIGHFLSISAHDSS